MNQVKVSPLEKDRYMLVEDYKFELPLISGVIPKGFKTDGASVPRIFWIAYPPNRPEYLSAAVIHDYLCIQAVKSDDIEGMYKIADQSLYDAMILLGVRKSKCWVFMMFCKIYHKIKLLTYIKDKHG